MYKQFESTLMTYYKDKKIFLHKCKTAALVPVFCFEELLCQQKDIFNAQKTIYLAFGFKHPDTKLIQQHKTLIDLPNLFITIYIVETIGFRLRNIEANVIYKKRIIIQL